MDARSRRVYTRKRAALLERHMSPAGIMSGYVICAAKRLALAQVLLNPPSVLLVDEPFEGLDHERIQLVTEHLNELKRTSLVIVATHIVPDALMVDWDYTFS